MKTILTISLMLAMTVSWAQEALLDYMVLINNSNEEKDTIRYSYDHNMNIDTIFYPEATRIYTGEHLMYIYDEQGIHRFEYLSGFVNEYLTADGDEYLKSVSHMGDDQKVLKRVFYNENGSRDDSVTYTWGTLNCSKKNNEINQYYNYFNNPYLKELKHWRLGSAGSTDYIKRKINGYDTIKFNVITEERDYPTRVVVTGPGTDWDYYYFYIPLEISTVGEIYDYEVGDIFHHRFIAYGGSYGFTEITNTEILDKSYTENGSTVNYTQGVHSRYTSSSDTGWTYQYYSDIVSYDNLDSLIQGGDIEYVRIESALYHGRPINYGNVYYDGSINLKRYVNGCGEVYYRYSWGTSAYEETILKYYKKGDEEWGTPQYVYVSVDEIPTQHATILSINYYDLMGREIEKPRQGFYIERKTTDKGVISTKHYIQ